MSVRVFKLQMGNMSVPVACSKTKEILWYKVLLQCHLKQTKAVKQ